MYEEILDFKMKIAKLITSFLLMLVAFVSCDHDEPRSLYFIGDSIVARWDLDHFINGYAVYNYGKSGAGYEYLGSFGGKMKGRTVVVEIGTNSIRGTMSRDYMKELSELYVRELLKLDAGHIYLYSVLPRELDTDPEGMNDTIRLFNSYVEQSVESYSNITYIDVFNSFLLPNGEIDPELYYDKLHISSSGYEVLAKALLSKLERHK